MTKTPAHVDLHQQAAERVLALCRAVPLTAVEQWPDPDYGLGLGEDRRDQAIVRRMPTNAIARAEGQRAEGAQDKA